MRPNPRSSEMSRSARCFELVSSAERKDGPPPSLPLEVGAGRIWTLGVFSKESPWH